MTDLLGDLDNAVQSFEGLQRALLRALGELLEAGLVERRHTGAFTEWRRKA